MPALSTVLAPPAGGPAWPAALTGLGPDVLVARPGDRQDPLSTVRTLRNALQDRRLDLVAGARSSGTHRGDHLVPAAARTVLGTSLHDPRSRSLALRRAVWEDLDVRSTTGPFATELEHEVVRQGWSWGEVPVPGTSAAGRPTTGDDQVLPAVRQVPAHRRRPTSPGTHRTGPGEAANTPRALRSTLPTPGHDGPARSVG